MSLLIPRCKLAYFPVPKVACTSIKTMLFEMKTGQAFEPHTRPNGRVTSVHARFSAGAFDEQPHDRLARFHRVALVRDPVLRFLSAYSNRVVFHRQLSEQRAGPKLVSTGLPADPSLPEFVDKFEHYSAAFSSINHHTRPMVHFLGQDAAYFSRLYRFSELGQFCTDMQALTQTTVALPHMQTGGPKLTLGDLSPAQTDKIRAHYSEDYAVFRDYL